MTIKQIIQHCNHKLSQNITKPSNPKLRIPIKLSPFYNWLTPKIGKRK